MVSILANGEAELEASGFTSLFKDLGITLFGVFLVSAADATMLKKFGLSKDLWYLKYPALVTLLGYVVTAVSKKELSSKAKDIFLKYSSKYSFKDHLGLQAEIQKETMTLLKTWITDKQLAKRKILLFVEDIDRYSEQKVIQLIDALRVLLEDVEIAKRVVIVAAVDERILKLAIKNKYHALLAMEKPEAENLKVRLEKMTDEYMDKLFISGIKLRNLSALDRDDFIKELTKADRDQAKSLRDLQEVIDDDHQYEGAKMTAHFQAIMIDDAIEMQQEQDDYEASLYENYEEPQFRIEYLEGSKSLEKTEVEIDLGKLAAEEVDMLRFAVSNFDGATPRQIRIFYYRYLMAKNLLARRYRSLSRHNVWIETRYARIVAKLIIYYTISLEAGLLEKHLGLAISSRSDNMDIFSLSHTAARTTDYRELLQVLNVVIAY